MKPHHTPFPILLVRIFLILALMRSPASAQSWSGDCGGGGGGCTFLDAAGQCCELGTGCPPPPPPGPGTSGFSVVIQTRNAWAAGECANDRFMRGI